MGVESELSKQFQICEKKKTSATVSQVQVGTKGQREGWYGRASDNVNTNILYYIVLSAKSAVEEPERRNEEQKKERTHWQGEAKPEEGRTRRTEEITVRSRRIEKVRRRFRLMKGMLRNSELRN